VKQRARTRAFVEQEEPHLVFCGHIHEPGRQDEIGQMRVVDPGPAAAGHCAVVELGETVTVGLDPRRSWPA